MCLCSVLCVTMVLNSRTVPIESIDQRQIIQNSNLATESAQDSDYVVGSSFFPAL